MELSLAAGVWMEVGARMTLKPTRSRTCRSKRYVRSPPPLFLARRHRIGRGQETKSPAQRATGSGHRSARRAAFQSIQSLSHGRRQPWLQSKPHDLEVE